MLLNSIILLILLMGLACPFVLYFYWKKSKEVGPIVDAQAHLARIHAEAERVERASQADVKASQADIQAHFLKVTAKAEEAVQASQTKAAQLQREFDTARARMLALGQQITAMDEELGEKKTILELREEKAWLEELLVIEHLNMAIDVYDDSGEYGDELRSLRIEQKNLAKGGHAAECSTTWQVGGSEQKGERMIKRTLDLMLRAFNGECDATIAKAKASNETSLEKRVLQSAKLISRLGEKQHCTLTDEYVGMKVRELHLVCAREEMLESEKEEQRLIREQMREEAKVLKEIEKARKESEEEERTYERALAKARTQFNEAASEQKEEFATKLAELEAQLAEAHEKTERSISQAQLTRAGHVYVISNIGSFGEYVYKVGMTRRLIPQERVDELGDASVPFRFDVHAMIYSEDAPSLEKAIHRELDLRRVNKVNNRKEFFRVRLEEIKQIVERHHGDFKLTLAAEAGEYLRSVELAEQ